MGPKSPVRSPNAKTESVSDIVLEDDKSTLALIC